MGFPGLFVQDDRVLPLAPRSSERGETKGHIGHKSSPSACVTELLTNGPNENRILLHSLLREIQEWIAATVLVVSILGDGPIRLNELRHALGSGRGASSAFFTMVKRCSDAMLEQIH
jgi:hypothetical protein